MIGVTTLLLHDSANSVILEVSTAPSGIYKFHLSSAELFGDVMGVKVRVSKSRVVPLRNRKSLVESPSIKPKATSSRDFSTLD